MYQKILEKIKEFDSITIFRHQRPDGDCMFSSLGLYQFIRDNFPEKKVKIAGKDVYDIISRNDKISDRFIKDSLAIVLDTSNRDRIDDDRVSLSEFIIKIDHHPIVESYGNINHVEVKASACAQILARMFFSRSFKGLIISEKTCRYLYCGMISDTINFRTTNVTADTMLIASKLIRKGDLKISELVEYVMDKEIRQFQRSTSIRTKLKIENRFGYIILKESDLNYLNMTQMEAKNNIDEIGTIKDLCIWAIAIENQGRYDCSVRSKRGYTINQICREYGGGGHVNAAAVKNLDQKTLDEFLSKFISLSAKKPVYDK